jgi:hypothetical protein
MHNVSNAFAEMVPGTPLPELRLTVSAAANERYWRAAGVDHPRLRAGSLYPPIAANLTILAFQQGCADAMIQTRQRLVCHRSCDAGIELVVHGTVVDRYDKRGRTYIDVEATIAADDESLWTSTVTFTPAATLSSPQ